MPLIFFEFRTKTKETAHPAEVPCVAVAETMAGKNDDNTAPDGTVADTAADTAKSGNPPPAKKTVTGDKDQYNKYRLRQSPESVQKKWKEMRPNHQAWAISLSCLSRGSNQQFKGTDLP